MKRKHVVLLLLLCMVVLFGCRRTSIVDKVSIVHVFGFDLAKNGELMGTALFPDYTATREGDKTLSLEEQAETSSLIVSKMATHTSTPIELAKVRVLVFGKKYAEAGIGDTVERLVLTPELGTSIHIAASTDSARSTLKTFKKEKTFTLSERIEQNMQGQALPKMNLHIFLNHFYGEGMDAYVPVLAIDDMDRIKVEGIGVFKNDQLKLHLNPEQSTLFSFIKDHRRYEKKYKINLDGGKDRNEIIIVNAYQSKKRWDWDQKKEKLTLDLQLQMGLTQYPERFNLEKPEDLRKMRKIIANHIETGIKDLIATLQKNKVDPIGIGAIVHARDTNWEKESFYEKYPDLPIDVNLKIEIIHSGLEG